MNGHKLKDSPNSRDQHVGSLDAPIAIVEYADFYSPECRACASELRALQREFSEDVCLVYRHFPDVSAHPNAGVAAVVAEAAGRQNEFWSMHDALFAHQSELAGDTMYALARELPIDLRRFLIDVEDDQLARKVAHDCTSAAKAGVRGVPYVFINGVHYDGMMNFEGLYAAVESIMRDNQVFL